MASNNTDNVSIPEADYDELPILSKEEEEGRKKKKGNDPPPEQAEAAYINMAPPAYHEVTKSPPPRPPLPSPRNASTSSSSSAAAAAVKVDGAPSLPAPRGEDTAPVMLPPVVGAVRVLPPTEPAASSSARSSTSSASLDVRPKTVTSSSAVSQNTPQVTSSGNTTIIIPAGTSMTMTLGTPGTSQNSPAPPAYQPAPVPPGQGAPPNTHPLTFVDFTQGPVSNQIKCANIWLQENKEYKVISVETVELPKENQGVSFGDAANISNQVSFSLRLASNVQFMRVTRLWLIPKEQYQLSEPPQKINYVDVVPLTKKTKKLKCESLKDAVTNFNNKLKKIPLKGRILNIQSLIMLFKDKTIPEFTKFDENVFTWIREGDDSPEYNYLTYLRVFHEMEGPPLPKGVSIQIGYEDFVPKQLVDSKNHRDFETFGREAQRAQNWINENPTKFVLNAQTIEYNFTKNPGSKFEAKTYQSLFRDTDTGDIRHLKLLRLFYESYLQTDASFYPEYRPMTLTYKTFCPARVTRETKSSPPKYETLQQTWQRMVVWVNLTKVKVISAETVPIKVYPGKCVYGDHEMTYLGHRSDWAEFWLYVVRVYINGTYTEPPPQYLPALPELPPADDKSNCIIL